MYGYQSSKKDQIAPYNLANRTASEALLSVVTELSTLSNDANVLDLGCGDGVINTHAVSRHYNLTAIDIEPAAINTLSDLFERTATNDQAIVGDLIELDKIDALDRTTFDAAVSWRVLHGIDPTSYDNFLRQTHNLLKTGASFYFSVACDQDWKAQSLGDSYNPEGINDCVNVMFRNFNIPRSRPFPVHFFTKDEIYSLSERNGFTLKSITNFQEASGYRHLQDKKNTYLFAHLIAL
jgi:cyclopropane fatty-acyl-phospholipid synthase-like methyltransferase